MNRQRLEDIRDWLATEWSIGPWTFSFRMGELAMYSHSEAYGYGHTKEIKTETLPSHANFWDARRKSKQWAELEAGKLLEDVRDFERETAELYEEWTAAINESTATPATQNANRPHCGGRG
jgi:hypothetical protein